MHAFQVWLDQSFISDTEVHITVETLHDLDQTQTKLGHSPKLLSSVVNTKKKN